MIDDGHAASSAGAPSWPHPNLRTACENLRPIQTPRLGEAPARYEAARLLPESELWRLWEGQRFPRGALVTVDGRPLRVIFRGRPGRGPGPDFRGAVIAAPEGLLQGDVELHVRTSDFRRHGHDGDPAYAGVALHVVFFHDESGDTPLPGGGRAPVAALGGPRLASWLAHEPRWGEPCRDVTARLGVTGVSETLDRLGAMRFRQKAAAFGKRLASGDGLEQALWAGLLEALAYGGEREAFRALAGAVPWQALRAALVPVAAGGRLRAALSLLAAAYEPGTARRGVRPGNGASRRLEGAAALAVRFAGPGLAASLIGPLAEPEGAAGAVVRALIVPGLVGRARAIEIAANAVLPLAAALCDEREAAAIEGVFARLPLPARYGSVRHLHAAAAGVRIGMRRQQGMVYLARQYCTQGGCGKCPLS
ncbi:MAG TPA: DUF2851 family protein [Dehalococcoidia bacterium]|nr:DUF2851 family protein [Dehalococcoidia bacterium]